VAPFSTSESDHPAPLSSGDPDDGPRRPVTWRAVLLAVILTPLNCFWIIESDIVRYVGFSTTISLFYNVVFSLLLVLAANGVLRRFYPRWRLRQTELVTVYVMLSISSALCGHDQIQILISMMAYPAQYASTSNNWDALFLHRLPQWLIVTNKDALHDFFGGNTTFYTRQHVMAWAGPALAWTAFIVALLFVMLCINVIVRKQWTESEKLTFPIIYLPLEMTDDSLRLWRNKSMWFGFGLAGAIDLLNGLQKLIPSLPVVPTNTIDLGPMITTHPWNAIGWTPLHFYPFAIGLGMLIPLDLLFSCWFFYVFWKAQLVFSAAMGWDALPRFPFEVEQSFGGYMAICFFAIYLGRRHFIAAFQKAIGLPSEADDSREPMSYRAAFLGVALGFAALVGFGHAMGISIGLSIAVFFIFFALSITITRIRAELGPPAHDLHMGGPDSILPEVFGTQQLGPRNLIGLTMLYWFNRAYRSHPMPHQLEGFKIAERTRLSYAQLGIAMMFAAFWGALCSFWAMLHLMYQNGAATGRVAGPVIWAFGPEPYNRLQSWLQTPRPPDINATGAIGAGILFALFLFAMRARFYWWPFHPVGYAISSSWSMNILWCSLLVAWIIKWALLHWGGRNSYQRAIPFFLGLMLGETVVGGGWTIVGIIFNFTPYSFWV